MNREPVVLISGVVQALLLVALAFGIDIPDGTADTIVAAVYAVVGLATAIGAAWKVGLRDRPTVVIIQGLVPAVLTLATALGFDVPLDAAATLQGAIAIVAAFFTRQQVTPVASGAAKA